MCQGLGWALSVHLFAKASHYHHMVGIIIFTEQKTDPEKYSNIHRVVEPRLEPRRVLVQSLYSRYFICSAQTWYITMHVHKDMEDTFFFFLEHKLYSRI